MEEQTAQGAAATEPEEGEKSRPVLPEGYGVPQSTEGLLPWSRVEEQLLAAKNYWVATSDKAGRPHAVPVWGAWMDGKLYFDGHPKTRWVSNLLANPAVSIHLESVDNAVILEGNVTDVAALDRETADKLDKVWQAKYSVPPSADEWVKRGLIFLKPSLVLAWDEFPTTVTRWKF